MRSIFVTFLCLVVANIFRFQVQTLAIQTLHIGGLYPFSGLTNGRQSSMKGELIQPAVTMAIEDVEKKAILPGYRLQFRVNDTECRADHASRVLFEMINKEPNKIALLGAGCSLVSERIAEVAKTWNLLMVSYGSTSPTLTKKDKYPLFFRTIPSDAACNKARVALLKKFNWMQVGLIGQSDIINSETTADLHNELAKENIEILTSETFADDPTAQVKSLKEKEARIIIGNFDEKSARKVFCQAFQAGMYGARYAWLIPGWFNKNWWKIRLKNESVACTEDEMNKTVKGYIACDNLKISPDNAVTVSAQSRVEFGARYKNVTGKALQDTDAGFAYDAVWTLAIALNRTEEHLRETKSPLSIENFTYANTELMEYFNRSLEETNFTGVTGPVQFTASGDRMGYMKIEQLQDEEEITVSLYLHQNDSILNVKESNFVWQGSGPPSDRTKLVLQLMTISSVLYGVACVITILCIILGVCFLVFNIKLRHYRYIQMSSPRLNNTIVVGCITMYLSVFLFGLDGNLVSPGRYSSNCQARIWLASLGFTTAFGAMFAKIWRVYVIFTNSKLRKKVIEDGRLFLFVGALLLVDIFTLSVWTGVDSLTRKLQTGTIEFIAVKRNPNVLNTSGATSTSASQNSGESSTSQEKGIGGPKIIALAAENSNLKNLVAEKEEEITRLEARLRKRGVPMENIRRISVATKRSDTIPESTPRLKIRGDRDDSGSVHIEVADSGMVSASSDTNKSEDNAERDPSSLRQRYSPSSSNIDKGVLLGNDLAKAHTAIAKKYSLPPRARKDIPQIETRARTRSADNEVQEAYDNPAISTETNDEATPRKKLSLTNRLESPFYTEPSTKTATQPLPSARARYGKPKKEEVQDPNSNALPAVKDEVQRKGSVVLVSKSQTGETCFQVKTPADFRKKAGKEKIQSSVEFNV